MCKKKFVTKASRKCKNLAKMCLANSSESVPEHTHSWTPHKTKRINPILSYHCNTINKTLKPEKYNNTRIHCGITSFSALQSLREVAE